MPTATTSRPSATRRSDRCTRQPRNIDTVVVDGRVLRRAGRFTALDHAQVVREAQEAALALRAKANWPPA